MNAERTGPPTGLLFSVKMLVHATVGQTYSFEEVRSWLLDAGYHNARTIEVPAPSPLILAQRP